MDTRRLEPGVGERMSFATEPDGVACGNVYPPRRPARVFRLAGVARQLGLEPRRSVEKPFRIAASER